MKTVMMHIFDFTRGKWKDDGNRLLLDGDGLTDGYFDTHVEGETVVKAELAAYLPDDPDGEHVVDSATFDSWLYQMDESNNYHWYECCTAYLATLSQEKLREMLGDELECLVAVSHEQLGYIDWESDQAIKDELDELRSTVHGDWAYDTHYVQLAKQRVDSGSSD